MTLKENFAPNTTFVKLAREHQNRLTKPTGALGELEDIACWLAGIQKSNKLKTRPAVLLIYAADHPVSKHGVSAYPREVTGAMVQNILMGGAASSVLCEHLNLPLHLFDVGVDTPYSVPELTSNYHFTKYNSIGNVGNLFETGVK